MSRNGGKISAKDIAALRKLRKEAIDKLDFQSAEQITRQMELGRDRDLEAIASQVEQEFQKELSDCLKSYNNDVAAVEEKSASQVMTIRVKYHRSFTALKQMHINQLAELEANYSDSIVRERDRTIPEQLRLLNEAKKAATNGDFQHATSLKNESRIVSQNDLQKRIEQLDNYFQETRNKTLNQQRAEIIQMTTKFEDELAVLAGEKRNKLESMYERQIVYVRGLFEKTSSRLVKEGYPTAKTRRLLDNNLTKISSQYNFQCPSFLTPEQK